MRVEIHGRLLPGRVWGACVNVHVGTQRGGDAVDLVPGDAPSALWCMDVTAEGEDFRGPWVQGRRGARFVYLTWGELGDDGRFEMFRRAKLFLADIPVGLVDEASAADRVLVGRLALTDGRGGPRCAAVRPPDIDWAVVPA